MPGKTSMTMWYIILSLAVFASAGFLGLEIRERIRPSLRQEDGIQVVRRATQNSAEGGRMSPQDQQQQEQRVATTFGQTKVFQPLVTPKPTNTPPPIPTATPTPLPLAMNYRIRNILGSSAILVDYALKQHIVRAGQVVQEKMGDFRVEKVDTKNRRVLVKLLSNGRTRWITEWDTGGGKK